MKETSSVTFGAKTCYRPIEAAIRWAGLLRFEPRILEALEQRARPDPGEFPRWPLLHFCVDRIFDGILHGELACGKAGIVRATAQVELADPQLTIRHVDLKSWVAYYYPGEKPLFLFDEIERALHPAINLRSLSVLLAENEASRIELTGLRRAHEALARENAALAKNRAAGGARAGESGPRSETTYLNIIGALLTLLLGKSPSGAAYSSFHNMAAVISALLAHHEGTPGLSERTLWDKLAQARKHLEASR
jgi:hypothetical protein